MNISHCFIKRIIWRSCDAFAGEETKRQKEKVVEIWRQYKEKQKELSEAGADESERAKELAFLQFEVDEIVQAELKEHEDEELESLYRRMCNGKRIVQSVTESYQYTGGDGKRKRKARKGT